MSDVLETYSPVLDRDLEDLADRDLGDLELRDVPMADALEQISAGDGLRRQLRRRSAVMIGGEHTASLGGFRGLKRVMPDAVILQVDAHLDMRARLRRPAVTARDVAASRRPGVRLLDRPPGWPALGRSAEWLSRAQHRRPGAAPT